MWTFWARNIALALPRFQQLKKLHWLRFDRRTWFSPGGCMSLAFAASLTSGLFVSTWTLFVAAFLAVILLVGILWPWLSLRGVQVEVQFVDRRGCEGQPSWVALKVVNRWPVPLFGISIEGMSHQDQSLTLARVAGFSRANSTHEFVPHRRGVYPLTTLRVATGFPFGIWTCRRPVQVINELLVWPRPLDLPVDLPISGDHGHGAAFTDRHGGNEGDIIGTRLFRRGDLLRDVHWAQTMRQRRWIVAERESTTRRQLMLDVDWSEGDILEQQIRAVVGIVELASRAGFYVEIKLDNELIVIGPVGRDFKYLLDQLARWNPSPSVVNRQPQSCRTNRTRGLVTTTKHATANIASGHGDMQDYHQVWIVAADIVEHLSNHGTWQHSLQNLRQNVASQDESTTHLCRVAPNLEPGIPTGRLR